MRSYAPMFAILTFSAIVLASLSGPVSAQTRLSKANSDKLPPRPADQVVTRFESNIEPPLKEICHGTAAYYLAKAAQLDVPMDRRQRFEIRECAVGGVAQVLAFESGQQRPILVYTTNGSWPLQVYHVVNVLVVPLSGSAESVLVFHFKNGKVQPVSGGQSKRGVGVQLNDDGTQVSVRLSEVLRYEIEY